VRRLGQVHDGVPGGLPETHFAVIQRIALIFIISSLVRRRPIRSAEVGSPTVGAGYHFLSSGRSLCGSQKCSS
jgi:hypothetical protein